MLQLHGLTELQPGLLPFLLASCPRLLSLQLPEFDILAYSDTASPEHYRHNFLLPSLHLVRQARPSFQSNIRKVVRPIFCLIVFHSFICRPESHTIHHHVQVTISDPDSGLMSSLWRQHGLELPSQGRLQFLLSLVRTTAPSLQVGKERMERFNQIYTPLEPHFICRHRKYQQILVTSLSGISVLESLQMMS